MFKLVPELPVIMDYVAAWRAARPRRVAAKIDADILAARAAK